MEKNILAHTVDFKDQAKENSSSAISLSTLANEKTTNTKAMEGNTTQNSKSSNRFPQIFIGILICLPMKTGKVT